jgi:hypothetical protein
VVEEERSARDAARPSRSRGGYLENFDGDCFTIAALRMSPVMNMCR